MKVGNIRIKLQREFNGFQAILVCLSRNAKEKGGIYCQPRLFGCLYRLTGLAGRDALADGIQVLLQAAFSTKQNRPAPRLLKGLEQGLVNLVDNSRGEPGKVKTPPFYLPGDFHSPVVVSGQSIVNKLDLSIALAQNKFYFGHDIFH